MICVHGWAQVCSGNADVQPGFLESDSVVGQLLVTQKMDTRILYIDPSEDIMAGPVHKYVNSSFSLVNSFIESVP